MTLLAYVSHAALVALVRGLQLATLLIWTSVVAVRGGSLGAVLFRRSTSRWDRQWSSITLFAATQVGFSLRWVVYHDTMAAMAARELAFWAVLYLSSAISAVGIVVSHGWWTDGRHRVAMGLHVVVIAGCILAAALVG